MRVLRGGIQQHPSGEPSLRQAAQRRRLYLRPARMPRGPGVRACVNVSDTGAPALRGSGRWAGASRRGPGLLRGVCPRPAKARCPAGRPSKSLSPSRRPSAPLARDLSPIGAPGPAQECGPCLSCAGPGGRGAGERSGRLGRSRAASERRAAWGKTLETEGLGLPERRGRGLVCGTAAGRGPGFQQP